MKKVYGSYSSSNEARRAIRELLRQGYIRDEIKVISKNNIDSNLKYTEDNLEKDDESLWDKIKEAFTFDQYHDKYWEENLASDEEFLLKDYRENLKAGDIIVLVVEGANAYRDAFRDGVPDWDEREEEFNE